MSRPRIDETWHRLREWTSGQAPSERLAGQLLLADGFTSLDPSHPLGGKDGGRDAQCLKDGMPWVMAVYFPRGQHDFRQSKDKFIADFKAAQKHQPTGFAFVTNQELRLAEREELRLECGHTLCEIYHLERIATLLDTPAMSSVRAQFLGFSYSDTGGGSGGSAQATNGAAAIGGRGGLGNQLAKGGPGGDAKADGPGSLAMGGDGGNAGTPDGRGGRRTISPGERLGLPTDSWAFGYGGAGANRPEYDRRLVLLTRIRHEYASAFPHDWKFIEAGIDPVPMSWVNKRLEELGEQWRVVGMHDGGYIMPPMN